jgi:putative acetyltransferase
LEQYGLPFEPNGADRDAIEVEDFYLREERGEFWVVVDRNGKLVGSGAYYEVGGSEKAVEIRKMYLLPEARGS